MKFSYVALTGDNKKITGVLEADSVDTAQLELHKMGVAIIAVNEITEDEYEKLKKDQEVTKVEKGIQTFTFVAVDKEGKEIEGTIDAIDNFSAYKRLRTEYQFQVKELYISNATDEEREMAKGTLEGFEARVKDETEREVSKKTRNDDEEDIYDNKELISDIDNIIINAKDLLKTQQEIFSNDALREISTTLSELERIRTSNNIKHITEVSNNLYELISNPDKITDKTQNAAYKSIISKLEDSALVKKEFNIYKNTGIQSLLEKIAERIKNATGVKKGEKAPKPSGAIGKLKGKINKLMGQITAKKATKQKKPEKPKSDLALVISKFTDYITASTPVLKKVRKKELVKAVKTFFAKKGKNAEKPDDKTKNPEKEKEPKKQDNILAEPKKENKEAEPEKQPKKKWDFTGLFVEIDSFISWLLCFYIMYFFLVDFSFEKNIGLSREFAMKTLKSELILDITIFLLIAHFILRIRNMHFRKNFMATLFLICFGIGAYALLIVNF
jgi:hypothetical protein